AALCYAIAAGIDTDPFVIFTLRGRTKEKVFSELRRRRIPRPAPDSTPPALSGIVAAAAYAGWKIQPPTLPKPPQHTTGLIPRLPTDPPPSLGLSAEGLHRLAADTATRAAHLLTGDTTVLHLTQRQDAVRLAAAHQDVDWFHGLQVGTGLRPNEFARLVRAWRHGGPDGVTTAEQPNTPSPAVMTAARTTLTRTLTEIRDDDTAAPRLRTWRNRLTVDHTGLQLRYGPDTRWYPYEQLADGDWWPCGPAHPDPATTLTSVWDRRRLPAS
ncbi:SWIM zinc finger family protein, partial [Streptomyces sp. NPDC055144]